MIMKHTAQIAAVTLSLLFVAGPALAQDAITAPAQKTIGGQCQDHTVARGPQFRGSQAR